MFLILLLIFRRDYKLTWTSYFFSILSDVWLPNMYIFDQHQSFPLNYSRHFYIIGLKKKFIKYIFIKAVVFGSFLFFLTLSEHLHIIWYFELNDTNALNYLHKVFNWLYFYKNRWIFRHFNLLCLKSWIVKSYLNISIHKCFIWIFLCCGFFYSNYPF